MIHNTERRIKMLENKTNEIDAYRNSIDFCIQDIDNIRNLLKYKIDLIGYHLLMWYILYNASQNFQLVHL